jgi:hypothetical protein
MWESKISIGRRLDDVRVNHADSRYRINRLLDQNNSRSLAFDAHTTRSSPSGKLMFGYGDAVQGRHRIQLSSTNKDPLLRDRQHDGVPDLQYINIDNSAF